MPAKAAAHLGVGAKIKKQRARLKLSLEQLANDTGCSKTYLTRIERGQEIPPVGVLLQLSKALNLDSGDLLKEQQEALDKRIQAYTTRTENYAYTTLTPGAQNKHLKAFRIQVPAMQEHQGVGYRHEGEEFVYVLDGEVEIQVGDQINRIAPGQSLHFNSGVQHHLRNIGRQTAELLVVVYAP